MGSQRARRQLLVVVLGVAAVAAGIWAWDKSFKQDLFAKRFGVVEPEEIYRSGRLSPAATRRVVERHGIRTEIDFGAWDAESEEERRARRTAEALDLDRFVLRLYGDATGDPNQYVDALELMTDPERQPVLVHCAAGTERTGAAVVFYRHIVEGEPLEAALAEAEAHGHSPARNPRLRAYVHEWVDEIAEAYRSGGEIPWPPEDQPAPQVSEPSSGG